MPTIRSFSLVFLVTCAIASIGCGSSSGGAETPGAPSAPTGVQAASGNGQVTISWTNVSGATSYNIYWSMTTGVTTANGNRITGASNPYTQTGLTPGTRYYYVVTAVNVNGESAVSAQINATPVNPLLPLAPTKVLTKTGNTLVSISWDNVSSATSNNIYWSTTSGVTPTTGTKITSASNPYLQMGLTNGTTYYYVVTAVNAFGESAASYEVSATPSAAPYIAAIVVSGVPTEWVSVCTDGFCTTPITNATVTVNGTALTYSATLQRYNGTQVIAPGAPVAVQVTIGSDVTYSVSGTQFTSAPTVMAPADNATWLRMMPNTISWSGGGPTSEAQYLALVVDPAGSFVGGGPTDIGYPSVTVPANTLQSGSYEVLVLIGTPGLAVLAGGIPVPDACSGSALWLGLAAPLVPITVQ